MGARPQHGHAVGPVLVRRGAEHGPREEVHGFRSVLDREVLNWPLLQLVVGETVPQRADGWNLGAGSTLRQGTAFRVEQAVAGELPGRSTRER